MTSSPIALPVNILQNKDGYVVEGLEFVLQSLQRDTSAEPANIGERRTVSTEKPQIVEKMVVPPRQVVEEKVEQALPIIKTDVKCIVTYNKKRKGFVLQISSWLTWKKAIRLAEKADKIVGFKTFKEAAEIPSLGRRYRVFIGIFKTREEAVAFCHQFDFNL